MRRWLLVPLVTLMVVNGLGIPCPILSFQAQSAPSAAFTTEAVTIASSDVRLAGTVLIPVGEGPWPAVALVHGAGPGLREENLGVAEAFAAAGILALVYDKRTEGYAADGIGGRDYDLLATDALAAVRLLQDRPDVRPEMVGLWGLSEGAWVTPLAAAETEDVAFLVLAGAAAIPPAQQVSWHNEQVLRHVGVAGSLVETASRDLVHLLVTTELLAEATHDPVPALERIEQPLLAAWGELDRTGPPADSAQVMAAALERAGNDHATLAFVLGANHDLKIAADDGFGSEPEYAPAYLDLITGWVNDIAAGRPPPSALGELPAQDVPSWPGAADPPPWLTGGWAHLIAFLVLLSAFPLYGVLGFVHRRFPAPVVMRTPARWLAVSGWLATLGLYGFLFSFAMNGTAALGPVVLGRPLPWLGLHLLAFVAVVCAVALVVGWARSRPNLTGREHLRFQILLTGAFVFIPWAIYWGLLTP